MAIATLTGLLNHVAGIFPSRRDISVSGKFELTHARLIGSSNEAPCNSLPLALNPGYRRAYFPQYVEVCYIVPVGDTSPSRATAAPLNAAYIFYEFKFYLSDSESKLLLTSEEGNEAAQAAAAKLNIPNLSVALSAADLELNLSPLQSVVDADSLDKLINDP